MGFPAPPNETLQLASGRQTPSADGPSGERSDSGRQPDRLVEVTPSVRPQASAAPKASPAPVVSAASTENAVWWWGDLPAMHGGRSRARQL
jgi:hypothetical protein